MIFNFFFFFNLTLFENVMILVWNGQHGYLLDGGKALEIRPLTSRLRKLLPQYSDGKAEEKELLLVAAHILRPADPLPDSLNDNAGYPGNDNIVKLEFS